MVAEELRDANAKACKEGDAIMQFSECEIEIGFEVEIDANSKVNVWAVEFGASGSQTTTHTVRVKYHALPGVTLQAPQVT